MTTFEAFAEEFEQSKKRVPLLREYLHRDLPTAWDRLGPAIRASLASGASHNELEIVSTLLFVCHGGSTPRRIEREKDPLVVEPRFLELAAKLRAHDALGPSARMLLRVLPKDEGVSLIERFPRDERDVSRVDPPARRDWVARYLGGEYAVWKDVIHAAPAIAQHPDLRDEALAVALELMKRVRQNADAVRSVMKASGIALAPEAEPATETDFAPWVERFGPLPIAVEAFYRVVGSIALIPGGEDRYDYGETTLQEDGLSLIALDPLEVASLDEMVACELRDYEYECNNSHPEIVGPLSFGFAPDFLHKQNISGGPPSAFELPPPSVRDAVDPELRLERYHARFVGFLRLAFDYGGFPSLDVSHEKLDDIYVNDRIAFEGVKGSWAEAGDRLLAKLKKDVVPF